MSKTAEPASCASCRHCGTRQVDPGFEYFCAKQDGAELPTPEATLCDLHEPADG